MKRLSRILFLAIMLAVAFSVSCSNESSQDTIKFTVTVQGGDNDSQPFTANYQINGDAPSSVQTNSISNQTCYIDKEITSDDYSEEKLETIDITATLTTSAVLTVPPTITIRVYRVDKSDNTTKVKESTTSSYKYLSLSYKYDEENSSSSSDSSTSTSSSSSSSE